MTYKVNEKFSIDCGFKVTGEKVHDSVQQANAIFSSLPSSLYKSIDFKTTSAVVGAIFCETLAASVDAIVNPIEKGHPDIVPKEAASASEEKLRNYPKGLELKSTIGNTETGSNLKAGQPRIEALTSITWQAHHREVKELMGLVWDFVESEHSFNFPCITAAFYTNNLTVDDWGEISGTTGRNTKVSGMKSSGKEKMGAGWVLLLNDSKYISKYTRVFKLDVGGQTRLL
jgi:hypothetical protein